jgi:diguanylate cyclase (GGDEF)-like protein
VTAEEERCRRYGHPISVIAVDLDGLKEINDGQGHEAGDRILARAADALRATARGGDVVARLGGDEFAILAFGCSAVEVGELEARVRARLVREGVAASVGGAARRPGQGIARAFKDADAAMYAAKRKRPEARSRLAIESGL